MELEFDGKEENEQNYINEKIWNCVSKPQYLKKCSLVSLISVWNYLFSVLGQGSGPVVSQEEAL